MLLPGDPLAPHITQRIASHVLYAFGAPGGYEAGSFTSLLIKTIQAADMHNSIKLCRAFPQYGYAVLLARDVDEGLKILTEIAWPDGEIPEPVSPPEKVSRGTFPRGAGGVVW